MKRGKKGSDTLWALVHGLRCIVCYSLFSLAIRDSRLRVHFNRAEDCLLAQAVCCMLCHC